jgi:NADP-dependent aldehyde dehydrogenase
VLLLPSALASRGAALGTAFAGSLTMGAGQFCTNPGLLLAIEGEGLDAFIETATKGVSGAPAQVMLTTGIAAAYRKGVDALAGQDDVETLAKGTPGDTQTGGAIFFQTGAQAFLANRRWRMRCSVPPPFWCAAPMPRNWRRCCAASKAS